MKLNQEQLDTLAESLYAKKYGKQLLRYESEDYGYWKIFYNEDGTDRYSIAFLVHELTDDYEIEFISVIRDRHRMDIKINSDSMSIEEVEELIEKIFLTL